MNQNEIYDEPPCSERPRDQPRDPLLDRDPLDRDCDEDEDCSAPIIAE